MMLNLQFLFFLRLEVESISMYIYIAIFIVDGFSLAVSQL